MDGKRVGVGVCRYPNGDRYFGDWRDNWRHGEISLFSLGYILFLIGKGTLQVEDTGNRYVGEWQKDKRHGQGILYAPTNMKIYDGFWWRNMPNGESSFSQLLVSLST